jgi:hydrogenase nickel incorporation protein HypA/HybF
MGIALEIHRVCREVVAEQGGGRLEVVRMAIGELSAIEPELLEYAWQAVVADTPDAAARLEITWCPARQHCARCGEDKDRSEGSWLRICPDCGLPLAVSGGDELDVVEVTLVAEDPADRSAGRPVHPGEGP